MNDNWLDDHNEKIRRNEDTEQVELEDFVSAKGIEFCNNLLFLSLLVGVGLVIGALLEVIT